MGWHTLDEAFCRHGPHETEFPGMSVSKRSLDKSCKSCVRARGAMQSIFRVARNRLKSVLPVRCQAICQANF
jgi:hypothetical protein